MAEIIRTDETFSTGSEPLFSSGSRRSRWSWRGRARTGGVVAMVLDTSRHFDAVTDVIFQFAVVAVEHVGARHLCALEFIVPVVPAVAV